MILAADYPFLNILWTVIFRRKDESGWLKALWVIFLIVLPFLGVLVYLIANHDGMADRQAKQIAGQQAQFDSYVREVADKSGGGAAGEIERAKGLLDSGAITQEEFNALKAKALAA